MPKVKHGGGSVMIRIDEFRISAVILYIKRARAVRFPRLRSFNICQVMLRMFDESVMASA